MMSRCAVLCVEIKQKSSAYGRVTWESPSLYPLVKIILVFLTKSKQLVLCSFILWILCLSVSPMYILLPFVTFNHVNTIKCFTFYNFINFPCNFVLYNALSSMTYVYMFICLYVGFYVLFMFFFLNFIVIVLPHIYICCY